MWAGPSPFLERGLVWDPSREQDCGREQIWGGQDLGKGEVGKGIFVDQRKKKKAESEPEKERVV